MSSNIIQSSVAVILLFVLLAGCVVRPSHSNHKAHNVKSVKVIAVLDDEHDSQKIIIVNTKPDSKRNCRVHKNHWHCNR